MDLTECYYCAIVHTLCHRGGMHTVYQSPGNLLSSIYVRIQLLHADAFHYACTERLCLSRTQL